MKWGRALGAGACIYAVMYTWSALLKAYGVAGTMPAIIASVLLLLFIAVIAGRSLNFRAAKDIAPYSALWMLEAILLDAAISLPHSSPPYTEPATWIVYVMIALAPLSAAWLRRLRITQKL